MDFGPLRTVEVDDEIDCAEGTALSVGELIEVYDLNQES